MCNGFIFDDFITNFKVGKHTKRRTMKIYTQDRKKTMDVSFWSIAKAFLLASLFWWAVASLGIIILLAIL